MRFEEAIKKIEAASGDTVPETTLSRVLMTTDALAKYNLPKLHDREDHRVWCLAVGQIHQRKKFFYGHEISDVVVAALRAFDLIPKAAGNHPGMAP